MTYMEQDLVPPFLIMPHAYEQPHSWQFQRTTEATIHIRADTCPVLSSLPGWVRVVADLQAVVDELTCQYRCCGGSIACCIISPSSNL